MFLPLARFCAVFFDLHLYTEPNPFQKVSMGITAFIFRAIRLSLAVGLRMLPILLLFLAGLAMLYRMLSSSPVAFFVIIGAFYLPMLVFLFLNAVRAGLMSLRATAPVDAKRLMTYTVRVMRFNFMLNNVIVGVLGLGTAVIAVLMLQPDLVNQLREGTKIESFNDLTGIFTIIGKLPLFILPVIALGVCVSIGANGGSIAASAASAASRGPNHDLLFGLARQFQYLFALGFVTLVVPLLVLQFAAGGVSATLAHAYNLGWGLLIAVPIYFSWVICIVAGGMALSYVLTLSDDDLAKLTANNDLMGIAHPPDDIRALRQARQRIIDGEEEPWPEADQEIEDLEIDANGPDETEKTDEGSEVLDETSEAQEDDAAANTK